MNQLFNLSRFGRLFRKHTAEHLRTYLLSTAVLLGGIGLVLGYLAYVMPNPMHPSIQAIVFIMGLLSAGPFFTSTVLAAFGHPRQATAELMLPASHLEKFLVAWLFALPIFLAVYVGCFYLMDSVIIQLDDWAGPRPALVPLFSNQEKLPAALAVYALVSAAFLWGSIYFRRQPFIRTAFGLLLGGALVSVLNFQVAKMMIGNNLYHLSSALPFSGMVFHTISGRETEYHAVSLPPTQNAWFLLVPLGLLLLLGWAGAYARLTEKQL